MMGCIGLAELLFMKTYNGFPVGAALAAKMSAYWLDLYRQPYRSRLKPLLQVRCRYSLPTVYQCQRISSVIGSSSLMLSCGTSSLPGVWPILKKRARRRLSASLALTGNVS